MYRILTLFLLLVATSFSSHAQRNINVITYNIRYNNPADGENGWQNRKDKVKGLLKFHNADIFCLQEALYDQVLDIKDGMKGFAFEGVGREDGISKGEFDPVFYREDRFSKVESGHFWLSENPSEPTKGWDAACIRICTWVKLKDRKTQRSICIFNTHFDHVGETAQLESAHLLVQKMEEITEGKYQCILTGDFNLTSSTPAMTILRDKYRDSYHASDAPAYGPEGTFNNFDFNAKLTERIDYIFVSKKLNVARYGVLSDSRDQAYYSDHLPVLTEIYY